MCMQEPNPRSSSGQKQQSRSSSTPVAIRLEDVLAADPSIGPRARSLAPEVSPVKPLSWRLTPVLIELLRLS